MSKTTSVVAIVMCLVALSVLAPSSMGVTKMNEPEYGKEYNIRGPNIGITWHLHVHYGDNISINCTAVPGNTTSYNVLLYLALSGPGYGYYLSSSCDTFMENCGFSWLSTNRSFWFVSGDDATAELTVQNNGVGNPAINCTINKVNATAGGQSADISRLEAMVSSLNQTVNVMSINITNLSAHIAATDGNISALQSQLLSMMNEFKSLRTNLSALQAAFASLHIPGDVNLSGIQENITELSNIYQDLYDNVSVLANQTGNVTHTNVTYENQTLVTNETTVYAYDNASVGNISKGLDDLSKRLAEVNRSLPEELAKMQNATKNENRKSRDSMSKEVGESSAAMGAGVGLGAGIAAGAGTSMAIGRRNSRAPIKGRPEDEILPTGGIKTGESEEFPKPPEQGGGQ